MLYVFLFNFNFNIILLYACLKRAFRLDVGLVKYNEQVGAQIAVSETPVIFGPDTLTLRLIQKCLLNFNCVFN